MIAHQKPRLLEVLRNNRSMKLNIRTEALFEKPEYNDGEMKLAVKNLYMPYLQPALISVMRMN